jgi:hypothetical protein
VDLPQYTDTFLAPPSTNEEEVIRNLAVNFHYRWKNHRIDFAPFLQLLYKAKYLRVEVKEYITEESSLRKEVPEFLEKFCQLEGAAPFHNYLRQAVETINFRW